jgi:hypothetical protein
VLVATGLYALGLGWAHLKRAGSGLLASLGSGQRLSMVDTEQLFKGFLWCKPSWAGWAEDESVVAVREDIKFSLAANGARTPWPWVWFLQGLACATTALRAVSLLFGVACLPLFYALHRRLHPCSATVGSNLGMVRCAWHVRMYTCVGAWSWPLDFNMVKVKLAWAQETERSTGCTAGMVPHAQACCQ